jgi:hypothetical protein
MDLARTRGRWHGIAAMLAPGQRQIYEYIAIARGHTRGTQGFYDACVEHVSERRTSATT